MLQPSVDVFARVKPMHQTRCGELNSRSSDAVVDVRRLAAHKVVAPCSWLATVTCDWRLTKVTFFIACETPGATFHSVFRVTQNPDMSNGREYAPSQDKP